MSQNKKPIIYLILKIVGFVLIGVGIAIIIVGTSIHIPGMGQDGWFEASSKSASIRFGGIACMMFGIFITITSFALSNHNKNVKTIEDLHTEVQDNMLNQTDATTKKPNTACSSCGAKNKRNATTCEYCGQDL